MTILVPCTSDVARPINRVERQRATWSRGRFGHAVLRIASDWVAVGLAVIPLEQGGDRAQLCQLGAGDATAGANWIRDWWTWWLAANIGVCPPRVVGRTRCGPAT